MALWLGGGRWRGPGGFGLAQCSVVSFSNRPLASSVGRALAGAALNGPGLAAAAGASGVTVACCEVENQPVTIILISPKSVCVCM